MHHFLGFAHPKDGNQPKLKKEERTKEERNILVLYKYVYTYVYKNI